MNNEEDYILITGYVLMFLFLLYRLITKKTKGSITLNFIIFIIYTSIVFYNRIYDSMNGTSLVWFFYGAIILLAHIIILTLKRFFERS
jgi:hypothetical protein